MGEQKELFSSGPHEFLNPNHLRELGAGASVGTHSKEVALELGGSYLSRKGENQLERPALEEEPRSSVFFPVKPVSLEVVGDAVGVPENTPAPAFQAEGRVH